MQAKDLVPGAKVSWLHFTLGDPPVLRTGEVWDRGPHAEGTRATAWVKPDQPESYDLYALILVGIANNTYQPAHGCYVDGAVDQYVSKGQLFSSSLSSSPLGNRTAFAMQQAQKARKVNRLADDTVRTAQG